MIKFRSYVSIDFFVASMTDCRLVQEPLFIVDFTIFVVRFIECHLLRRPVRRLQCIRLQRLLLTEIDEMRQKLNEGR